MTRHNARATAMQMLYQMDMGKNSIDLAINTLEEAGLNEESQFFAANLVHGVYDNLEDLDNLIDKYSNGWAVDRIASVDKTIMRIATYELMYTATPPNIVIDEALKLVKIFAGDESIPFVNGILDGIWKNELIEGLDQF